MKKELLSITDKVFISVILLIAAVLRLYHLDSVPFMHDEFSALSRTSYDSFSELIQQGIKIDGHPAGTQLFLYYMVKLFGWNEFWLKLPFALMGIASVFLIFKIGQQWFNTNVGLISAAFASVSEIFIFYSQIIRPYSPGIFSVLLFVYFWNRLLFIEEKPSIKTCIGFTLAAFLSSQMHNFSVAQAGLIYLSGLLFLKKDNKLQTKAYLLSGIAALLLFLPTSPIFYHQIFVNGGIGGWLSLPKSSFIIDFFKYTANYSQLFIFVIIVLIIYPFLVNKENKDNKIKLRIIGLSWFLIPLILAYIYSLMREPILQFRTLTFAFPFLFIVLFSFYDAKKINDREKSIIMICILLIGISSLINDRQYYKQILNQGFDSMAEEMKEDMTTYGDSITFVSFSNRTLMTEFYQDKENISNNKLYDKNTSIYELQDYLSSIDTKYIGIGIADYGKVEYEMLTMMFYPHIIKERQWLTTKYLLLSKEGENDMTLMKSDFNFQRGEEWGCSFEMTLDSIDKIDDFGFIAEIQSVDTISDIVFVMELKDRKSDSTLYWQGKSLEGHSLMPNERHYICNELHFDNDRYDKNDLYLDVYLWNKGKYNLNVEKIFFYNSIKGPYFLGLYEPLK